MSSSGRGSILVEEAALLSHQGFPGGQHLMRLAGPGIAARAEPGTFVHVRCDALLPLRRPMSIMRADPHAGWLELLFKEVGEGTRVLADQPPGEPVSLIGPIGRPFSVPAGRTRALLIGGGVGIPPMVFLAERLRAATTCVEPFLIMGSEIPFPFPLERAREAMPGVPAEIDATMPLMNRLGVASRLASLAGYPGCYRGYVTGLADAWLGTLDASELAEVAVFACGPTAMLRAVAALARARGLPCQVALEAFMACAVGGCAGCTVRVRTPEEDAMKRVCVDGPVFEAESVFFS